MRSKIAYTLVITTTLLASALPARANPSDSWIQTSVLATDHRAYCDDIVAQNVTSTESHHRQNNSGSQRQSSANSNSSRNSRSRSRQIGGRFLGIGGNIRNQSTSDSRQNSRSQNESESRFDRGFERSNSSNIVTSVTAGQNCSTFVESAAQRDISITNANAQRDIATTNANAEVTINRDQQETMRLGIEVQRELGLEEIQSRQQMFMMDRFLPNYNQIRYGQP